MFWSKHLQGQISRSMSTRILNLRNLADNYGAKKKPKRVGRGPGSGLGKTCGKGHKGTYQRRALHKRGFEGGQTPLWKRTRKYGRSDHNSKPLTIVNLDKVFMWIQRGRLDPTETITMKALKDCGLLGGSQPKWGVKLLNGFLHSRQKGDTFEKNPIPLTFEVTEVSDTAKQMIEEAGGKVKCTWFTPLAMRAHFQPWKFAIPMKSNGIPPPKKRSKYREYMEEYFEKNPQFREKVWMPPNDPPPNPIHGLRTAFKDMEL